MQSDPLRVNSALGIYTAFANLLDLSAVAVPAGFRNDGLPTGVTLLGPWGADARLAGFGSRFHRSTSTQIGATTWSIPPTTTVTVTLVAEKFSASTPAATLVEESVAQSVVGIPIAVVGAHLSGEPLNHQLTSVGGQLLRVCSTAPHYRLFALPNTTPPKPGLIRISSSGENEGADNDRGNDRGNHSDLVGGGGAIELEVWSLPPPAFAAFVARIPAPLCIGKIELDDGTMVSGFLCEGHAVTDARDITTFGGWRAYLRAAR
ncbi:MAG: hypothetical protein H7X95_04215 [Deltaproteobacteria bacterium]|nr:hypothetical protein [Deltaproteobacteria bacterium]